MGTVDEKELERLLAEDVKLPFEMATYSNYDGYSISVRQVGCIAERWPAANGNEVRVYGELIVAAVNALPALLAERKTLIEALEQISEGRGRFSLDHHEHAKNTIEDMKEIALTALAGVRGERAS